MDNVIRFTENNQKSGPIYYNINSQLGYRPVSQQDVIISANIEELNNQVIIDRASDYYVSVARAVIPTNYVPLLIVPIESNLGQADINKCIYTITFQYIDAMQVPIGVPYTRNVAFISQTKNPNPVGVDQWSYPLPPSLNNGLQDVSTYYYYIYDSPQFLYFYNKSLQSIYQGFVNDLFNLHGIVLPNDAYPILTLNRNTLIFSINFPINLYDQAVFPCVNMYVDQLTIDTLNLIGIFDPPQARITQPQIYLVASYNSFDNNITFPNLPYTYYKMENAYSNLNMWAGMSKIIITVNYGISSKFEYDSLAVPFGLNTNQTSLQKPLLQYLADFTIVRNDWYKNPNYVQFDNGGNITESRLIELSGQIIQSFSISVRWLDCFGNIRPLELPSGVPLSMKLAFWKKTNTSLI